MARRSHTLQLWFFRRWPRPGEFDSPAPGPLPRFFESVPGDRYRTELVDREILDEAAEEAGEDRDDPKAFVPGAELARLLLSLNGR